MVMYAVAFTYTNHADNYDHYYDDISRYNIDHFYDDVKKINLYVFDSNNLVYKTETAISPYEKNFNIPLELPMGNYHILAWCNVLDSEPFDITPHTFDIGKTTLNQARLTLLKTFNELNNSKLEKLFFGDIDVQIPLYTNPSRIDTIPLINNTKHVRVVLHWDHSGVSEQERINHSHVVVRLTGSDARYKFDDSNESLNVTYAPFHQDLRLLRSYPDTVEYISISYVPDDARINDFTSVSEYEFKVLRLFVDLPLTLSVDLHVPVGNDTIKHAIAVRDIISRTSGFENRFMNIDHIADTRWQNIFDRHDNYKVDVYIIQVHYDTFVTGNIKLNDWWKINNTEPGLPI
jgi:hypothetical protein